MCIYLQSCVNVCQLAFPDPTEISSSITVKLSKTGNITESQSNYIR